MKPKGVRHLGIDNKCQCVSYAFTEATVTDGAGLALMAANSMTAVANAVWVPAQMLMRSLQS